MASNLHGKVTLCIDVGLRNLAMNIMNSDYTILLWDVYNILDSDDHHCQDTFKNGKLCNRKCNMKYILPNKEGGKQIFCCKTHFPKSIKATKVNDFKKKSIDAYLLQDIAKAFIKRVQEIYDENPIFKKLNTILIELQPKCNAKMLFTSHVLYGKLVELYKDTDVTIRFVRASQKLKAYTGPEIKCTLKGKYAQRKWLSIQYTKWFLENKFSNEQKEKWLPILLEHKKADDLSDCALMAINSITGIPKKQLKHKNGNELK
jgi:hypothetical protein